VSTQLGILLVEYGMTRYSHYPGSQSDGQPPRQNGNTSSKDDPLPRRQERRNGERGVTMILVAVAMFGHARDDRVSDGCDHAVFRAHRGAKRGGCRSACVGTSRLSTAT